MANLIGQRLGNYEIIAKLGSGGMATVYRARQLNIQRDVAIKVIKSDLAESPDFIRRFEREAQTIASLDHPHILKVFDYGQHDELIYLVMELKTGGTLDQVIRQNPLSLEQTAGLLDQIAGALDYAHRKGVIHRDLKPQNVLLDESGNAFLTDFGIAKLMQNQSTVLTQAGTAMGTPSYMSPEQWLGQSIDNRTDIYALGIMLYEMISGQLPFTAETPYGLMHLHVHEAPPPINRFRSDVPPNFGRLIAKAIAKSPDQRFQSAGELAAAFKSALAGSDPVPVVSEVTMTPPALPIMSKDPATSGMPVRNTSVSESQSMPTLLPSPRKLPLVAIVGGVVVVLLIAGLLIVPGLINHSAVTPVAVIPTSVTPTALVLVVTATSPSPAAVIENTSTPTPTSQPTQPTQTPQNTFTLTNTVTNTSTNTDTATNTLSQTVGLDTLVAATFAARVAAYTKTPTPNTQQTLDAIVGATDTAVAQSATVPSPTPSASPFSFSNTDFASGDSPTPTLFPSQTPLPQPTAIPVLHIGGHAQVYVTDEGLKLRSGTDISNSIIENLPRGTIVTLIDGPQLGGGYIWWKVSSPNGNIGWVVQAADGINTLIPLD